MVHAVAVAAPHPAAVDAARAVAAQGGGAVDAALAAAAALTVAYPHQCSIGGDLIALVRSPDGVVRTVFSAGAAARSTSIDALRKTGWDGERMPPGGAQTITVPGVVAGWAALAELGARLDLARILAPAIALASGGVPVSPGLARATQDRIEVVRADPGLSAMLLDADELPLAVGARLRQGALAGTLTTLAQDWRSFYTGALAGRLVTALQGFGSPLTGADFAAHRAEQPEPVSRQVDGVTWWVAPPPSQGAALLSVLGASTGRAGDSLAAARSAELRRDVLLGDPRTGPVDLDGLLGTTRAPVDGRPTGPKPAGDTVAVTVVADDGSAVCLIQSVFQSFGSGLLDPDTGVVFHNRGSAFSLDPVHPGRLKGGSRPPHTLCPSIGVGPDAVVALGCQGGRAQAWILSQVAADVITAADSAGLDAVLSRPRWVIGSRDLDQPGPTLLLEPEVPDTETLAATAAGLGLAVVQAPTRRDDAGHIQVSRLGPTGLAAASDPRADGRAEIMPIGGGPAGTAP
jgi:gamma-glutamyltranspeptidase